jgi:GR25 family glycosyltransferase involved in LPS biosynthesis
MNKIKAYCINLERAKERRENSEKQYQQLGIDFEFITAVDGKSLTDQEIQEMDYDEGAAKRLRNIQQSRGLSRMEMACSLSHLKAYRKIVEDKISIALISEDDVVFNFKKDYLENLIKELPENWEICFLFHRGLCRRISNGVCRFLSLPGGAVCYLLNLGVAQKLLDLAKPLRLGPDILIGRATLGGFLKGYGAFPVRVRHEDKNFSFLGGGLYKESIFKKIYHYLINHFILVRNIKHFFRRNKNADSVELY